MTGELSEANIFMQNEIHLFLGGDVRPCESALDSRHLCLRVIKGIKIRAEINRKYNPGINKTRQEKPQSSLNEGT